jgi:thioredoxin-like negative regulator of GroEL
VLLLFTEKTCADAAKMAAVLKDPRVVAAMAAFVPALVDNDDNEPLAERYGVRAVPMLVFASSAGEAIGSSVGVTNADEVLGDIKGALAQMKEDADEAK